jgi:RNA polymerase sigma factor (sigma-70 family)
MSAPSSHSITVWLERLRAQDPQAAGVLLERFFEQMLDVARQRLRGSDRRVADEEDAVVVAFERFLHGARNGRFPCLSDRNDLWSILFTLTENAALKQRRDLRRLKRGGGAVRGDSPLATPGGGAIDVLDDALTPQRAAEVEETLQLLLAELGDPSLRQIALWRMEGFSNAEIAGKLDCAVVTVERRLQRIRAIWQQFDPEENAPG